MPTSLKWPVAERDRVGPGPVGDGPKRQVRAAGDQIYGRRHRHKTNENENEINVRKLVHCPIIMS